MAKLLKLRRGTTSQHNTFTGAEGEVTIDTTKDTAVVHDGSTAGGRPLAREDMSNVSSSSIAGRLGADAIAVTKIAGGTLPSDVKITDANVSGNLTIANADINADAVNGSKIADNSINSEHYVDGSIDRVHLAGDIVDGTKIADNSINSEHYVDGSIDRVHLAGDIVDGSKIADDSINSEHYVNGSIDTAHLANDIVDATKLINFPSNTILGRETAGTGNATTLSASQVRGIINVENGATADQTAAEIRTLVESASDSNVFTDADHSKLNGIESGATADQTASEILTLIKTVDGSGSGLDADTVDGLTSGSFVRNNNGAQTIAGNLTVGTGTASYIYMVDSDHGNRSIHNNSNQIGFLKQDGNWGAYCDDSGNWTAAGNVTAYSDSRLKTDISTINDALGIVGKLRGVSYKWLRDGSDGIGVIAQEVEEVLPSVVVTTEKPGLDGMEEVKSVDYGKIVGVLINAINELKAEVDELKGGK